MDAELAGDGTDAPVLGEEQPADAGAQLGRDHRSASSRHAGPEPTLAFGAAGAGERLVADESTTGPAARATEAPRARGGVRVSMGGDLGAGRAQRRRGARCRRGAHHRGGGRRLATVMRHFRASTTAVSPLAIRVGMPPLDAALVPPPGRGEARAPGRAGARGPAVPVAPVAVPAEEEHLPARWERAGHEPQRFQARPRRGRELDAVRLDVRSTSRWIATPC